MGQILLTLLVIGALQFPKLSLSNPAIQDQGSAYYLVNSPTNELDPITGQITSYEIISGVGQNDMTSRAKRETTVLTEEADKGAFTKKPPVTKKPTALIKEAANNVSISMTTSTAAIAAPSPASPKLNKPMTATTETPSVPPQVSSSPKTNDSTTGMNTPNTTLTPPDLYPEFPEFPPDYADFSKNKNYSSIQNDTHRYYNSSYFPNGGFLWVDLDNHPDAETHELLSNAHRRAATVKLEFEFPFYGHLVSNVTMATGGFIYLGEQVHAWLAATQYIAPLMANFDSRMDNASSVRYLSNATQFTVEWNQVHLHNSTDTRPFTFQTSLYKNGTIVFAYKQIPIEVKKLNDTHHPVKVGLSDAYITDKTILFVKSRTIFEYDRVDLKDKDYLIVNGSGIVFSALPTCLSYTNCEQCVTHRTQFNCVWCPRANRCGDGTDRYRQEWIVKSCTFQSLDTRISCFIGTTSTESSGSYRNFDHDDHDLHGHDHDDTHALSPAEEQYNHDHQAIYTPEKVVHATPESSGMSASGITGLLFFMMLIFGAGGWLAYAYYYPHSTSGQLLIRFRPSQWGAFRRGEARYTAASSIHM